MCRSVHDDHGFYIQKQKGTIKIRSFTLCLSVKKAEISIPQTLTLIYLPKMNNVLEINDAKVRPDTGAFVELHRVKTAEKRVGELIYACVERVRVSEGVGYEIYFREDKIVKGVFGKDEEDEWRMMCKCHLDCCTTDIGINGIEICVVGDGFRVLREMVEMVKRRKKKGFVVDLEEIPEESETESEDCDCQCEWKDEDLKESEGGMEGVGWAVDVGIWVVCLGVGLLVSRASAKRLGKKMR